MPSAAFNEILQNLSSRTRTLNYIEPQGSLELREALALHLQTSGIQASPDSILIVSGSLQALHLISVGLLPRGSAVLLEKPSYLYSIHAFQSAGLKLNGIPMDEEGLDLGYLDRAIQTAKRASGENGDESFPLLYTIPSFHNPTGGVMSRERREQLMSLARISGISILEDAAYQELWLDHPPRPRSKQTTWKAGCCIWAHSPKQSAPDFALAGLSVLCPLFGGWPISKCRRITAPVHLLRRQPHHGLLTGIMQATWNNFALNFVNAKRSC